MQQRTGWPPLAVLSAGLSTQAGLVPLRTSKFKQHDNSAQTQAMSSLRWAVVVILVTVYRLAVLPLTAPGLQPVQMLDSLRTVHLLGQVACKATLAVMHHLVHVALRQQNARQLNTLLTDPC